MLESKHSGSREVSNRFSLTFTVFSFFAPSDQTTRGNISRRMEGVVGFGIKHDTLIVNAVRKKRGAAIFLILVG
jgi:hypothetical protein